MSLQKYLTENFSKRLNNLVNNWVLADLLSSISLGDFLLKQEYFYG
ncbi:hypothetical protein PL8927_830240 [Planktothrix serta PCC 8927]|uniref:Uncharacterized protein n=1 Tax=Planktothrix serta PCC 8927 TaxID=671068 RepID=A0A7Z9E5F8_9CYAN|nr:hypothetical protein PL8927_830240 [Planktothrix serta PCC 8927]